MFHAERFVQYLLRPHLPRDPQEFRPMSNARAVPPLIASTSKLGYASFIRLIVSSPSVSGMNKSVSITSADFSLVPPSRFPAAAPRIRSGPNDRFADVG